MYCNKKKITAKKIPAWKEALGSGLKSYQLMVPEKDSINEPSTLVVICKVFGPLTMLSFKGKLMLVLIKASACGPILICWKWLQGPPELAESAAPRLVETGVLVTGVYLQLWLYWSSADVEVFLE